MRVPRELIQSVLDDMGTGKIVDGYIPFYAFDPQEAICLETSGEALTFMTLLGIRMADQDRRGYAHTLAERGRLDFVDGGLRLFFKGVEMR